MSKLTKIGENPKAPLSGAVVHNGVVYVSGQVGFKPGTTEVDADICKQCNQTMTNLDSILAESGTSNQQIIRCGVYLPHLDRDFAAMNECYVRWLGDHRPARSTIGAQLARPDLLVEIDCIAALT